MKRIKLFTKANGALLFNSAKIAAGCAAAIVLSSLLGLRYTVTAGLITVLSIQNTKRETAEIAIKRVLAFAAAIVISYICFILMGYNTPAFAVYLFEFIIFCQLSRSQSAIVPVSVLIAHFLGEKSFAADLIINEALILIIGVGTGFLLNLYLHKDIKQMENNKSALDNEIKAILGRMADRVLVEDKSDYNGECFERIRKYLDLARETAVKNKDNSFSNADQYDLLYLEMREKQCGILYEMYKAVKELNAAPHQVHMVSDLLKKISLEYHEDNDVNELISETEHIFDEMKKQPMPETRSEFENRAVLYSLLIMVREFLSIKYMFMKSRLENS